MSFDIAGELKGKKSRRKNTSRKSIYDRQREEETIRNATNRGYLRRMTMEFLNDNVGLDDRDLPTVGYLNITSQQLSSLGALEMCISLRICVLPGNYITEFDALIGCLNLWALDLHGNQIKKVPGPKFWSTLKQLQIVLLHDNGISKLETIHHLSSSSSLLILTLYDTPLSLKKNYRHHVVNGVWSLKALDCHVVSDEEIIEDSEMPEQFAALQKNFRIDVNHTLTKESSLEAAVKQMEELKARVNRIQAKYSPVLLIQKTFRMFAIRKRYKYLMDTRVWAATSIQRFYRFHKGITNSQEDVLPPPTSPYVPSGCDNDDGRAQEETKDDSGGLSQDDSNSSRKTKESIGYNLSVEVSSGRSKCSLGGSHELKPIPSVTLGEQSSLVSYGLGSRERSHVGSIGERLSQGGSEGQKKVTRRMTVDLMKLESSAIGTIESATSDGVVHSGLGLDKKSKTMSKDSKSKSSVDQWKEEDVVLLEHRKRDESEQDDTLYKRRLKPEMVGKYRTVRVFLGQVVEPKAKNEVSTDSEDDAATGFRLEGEEPPKQKNEPIAELLLSKKEMGEDVRRSLRQFRRKRPEKRKKVTEAGVKLTNDQRLFLRTHGTMGLACLRAVHQAYEDRAQAQRQVNLSEHVSGMKERREECVERLQNLKQEYQESVLRERIREGVRIADALRENEMKQNRERRKVSEGRAAAAMEERMRQAHLAFAREFACQQNSVSQALRHHDQVEMRKERLKKLGEAVRRERQNNLEKQTLVKKYMEHRRLINQAEMCKAKAEINARLVDEANKHFLEVQGNMERTKTMQSKVNEFYSLPPLNAPNVDTPLAIVSPAKLSQLEEWLLERDYQYFDEYSNSDLCSENVC